MNMPRERKRRPTINVIERILRHLPDGLTDEDCWITSYAQPSTGYITIQLDGGYYRGDKMMRRLHRVAWEAHNAEPIPEGMVVLHSCDNPACINPHHLSVGTLSDNTRDMYAKGRDGTKILYSRERMRELRELGYTHQQIADELGCSRATVSTYIAT